MEKNTGFFKPGALKALARTAVPAIIVMAALFCGGCLVGNDDFKQAQMKRDEYRHELQRLHQSNDILKREIAATYESCNLISTQLTVMAALNIHDRYTANLGRPILPPPLPATTATTPSRTTRTQRAVRGEQSGRQGEASGRTGAAGGSRQGSGGGTRTAPPPTPPANSGGGGSIDWGF